MHFTPTQQLIMDVLSDGNVHSAVELERAIGIDSRCSVNLLGTHLSNLRKILRPHGEDVATHLVDSRTFYQHVRLLSSPYRG